MRRWLARRRFKQARAEALHKQYQQLPWVQLSAAMHHSQHPGEYRDDCGRCRTEVILEVLDEMVPLPTGVDQ